MDFEKAFKVIDTAVFAKTNKHLKDIEVAILQGSYLGQTYEEIASSCGYTADYLKQDVGSKLWKLLSEALGEKVSKTNFQAALERRRIEGQENNLPSPTLLLPPSSNWGEAIDVSVFFGRTEELATLTQWIIQDRCRLVTLLGIGGIGKTTLAAKLAERIQGSFEYLIWRSLRHAPPAIATFAEINQFLAGECETAIPATLDAQISDLINSLRAHRCLLILDDWEIVLRGGDIAGYSRQGYEGYGHLLKRVGEERHQSTVVLLSREKPIEVAAGAGENSPIRALQIKGLKPKDALQLLATKGFDGTEKGLDELIQIYRGHPTALKTIATTIQDLFNGNICQFIGENSLVVGDIFANILHQHFDRLSDLEKEIMYWLAIACQPISLPKLKNILGLGVSSSELLAVLESLSRRSLIEKEQTSAAEHQVLFTLQPVVSKYVTNQFIQQICQDIIQATSVEQLGLLRSHMLVKEDEPEEIRAIQACVILTRVQEHLRLTLRGAKSPEVYLVNLLSKLHGYSCEAIGYAAYNLRQILGSEQ